MPVPATTPLIGVSGRRRQAADIAGFAAALGHLDVDLYLVDYTADVLSAGGVPVLIPIDCDPAVYIPHLDGVLLTGGADIEPGRYKAEPDGAGFYEPERDRIELGLLEAAMAVEIPVLGICRGLQILNVFAGGTLHQDVPPHSRYDVDPAGTVHRVSFEDHSRVRLLYGESTDVNSLHHQTVDRLGDGLTVTGWADDGTVEAVETPGRDVLAVQWHPEMRPEREPVFDWLVKRATALRATR